MSSYAKLLEGAAIRFERAGVEDARLNARELLAKALGSDCRSLTFNQKLTNESDEQTQLEFERLCLRRLNGEPLQYLVGEWEFYGLPFKVGRGVLIPRQDTETLVDMVIKKAPKDRALTVIDLCAGSGCIGIALEKNLQCESVTGVELFDEAIEYMKQNIKLNHSKMIPVKGDVTDDKTAQKLPSADVITANPPYLTAEDMKAMQCEVTFEPQSALFGGEDGLELYRHILINFKEKLKSGGLIAFEIGKDMQEEVMTMLIRHGFENVRAHRDMCGVFRCVTGYKK